MSFRDWITDKRTNDDEIKIGSMPFCVVLLASIILLVYLIGGVI